MKLKASVDEQEKDFTARLEAKPLHGSLLHRLAAFSFIRFVEYLRSEYTIC